MSIIITITWSIFILFIWFKTNAFVEYCKVLRLGKILKINNWEVYRLETTNLKYLEYISLKHKNFITSLISCVDCILVWIVLINSIIFDTIYYYPITYIISYFLYKIIKKYG